jgi:hypothetical protein
MKLFHFTTADKVLPIKERGLLPSLEPQMSPDHAVVWLTSQPDVSLTERDAKAMALWLQAYEAPLEDLRRMRAGETEKFEAGRCKRWRYGTMGERLHMVINGQERTVTFVGDADDLVRLAIDVREDDANLHRYSTWPNRPKMRRHRAFYQLDHVRLWYVYLARIAPVAITEVREMSRW